MLARSLRSKIILGFLIVTLFPCYSLATDTLITSNPFTYQGAFIYYDGGYWGGEPVYNATGNSGSGSLIISAGTAGYQMAEISIPTLYTGTDFTTNGFDTLIASYKAALLNNLRDITYPAGAYRNLGVGGADLGASGTEWSVLGVVSGSTLYGTIINDGASGGNQKLSLFKRSTDITSSGDTSFVGMIGFGSGVTATGGTTMMAAGPMTTIPSGYQSQLGGDLLVASHPYPVNEVENSSFPVGITSFYSTDVTEAYVNTTTMPGILLAGYPTNHRTLGCYNPDDCAWTQYYSGGDAQTAIVFPSGTRTIMVIGYHGTGNPGLMCGSGKSGINASSYSGPTGPGVGGYMYPTNDCAEVCYTAAQNSTHGWTPICHTDGSQPGYSCGGTITDLVHGCAYDGWIGGAHSPRAWPYKNFIWAYDVGDSSGNNTSGNSVSSLNATYPEKNNLTAVNLGQIHPYDMVPYATWEMDTKFGGVGGIAPSVNPSSGWYRAGTFDTGNNKLYMEIWKGTQSARGSSPIYEVYQLGSGGDTTAPSLGYSATGAPIGYRSGAAAIGYRE